MIQANLNISETQAIALAKRWLQNEIGETLPVSSAFFIPETKAGEENDYVYDMPARWMVIFQTNAPKHIEPNQIGVEIDQETGEITSIPL